MRMLLKAIIPTEAANAGIRDGSMMANLEKVAEDLMPEAVYFTLEKGKRAMLMIINMDDSSELVGVVEPLFLSMGARVTLTPVLNAEDFEKAGPGLGAIIEKYS